MGPRLPAGAADSKARAFLFQARAPVLLSGHPRARPGGIECAEFRRLDTEQPEGFIKAVNDRDRVGCPLLQYLEHPAQPVGCGGGGDQDLPAPGGDRRRHRRQRPEELLGELGLHGDREIRNRRTRAVGGDHPLSSLVDSEGGSFGEHSAERDQQHAVHRIEL